MTKLFVAVFGGAIAWSLHLVLSYLVIGLACRPEGPLLQAGSWVTTAILLALSAAAAAVTVGAAIVAARIRRADGEPAERGGSWRGLGLVGLVLNAVFLVAILFAGSAVFALPAC